MNGLVFVFIWIGTIIGFVGGYLWGDKSERESFISDMKSVANKLKLMTKRHKSS